MITHWETLPYAAVTFLGAVSLIATIASTFYTTASDVMVSPKLKYGGWDNKEIRGHVLASYANTPFTQSTCPTPLRRVDEEHGAIACLDIQHAGQCKYYQRHFQFLGSRHADKGEAYRNLMSFMTVWDDINRNGTGASLDMSQRPVGTTLLYDNTTLTSAWIKTEFSNATAQFEKTSRIINNVTLAMPHPGKFCGRSC